MHVFLTGATGLLGSYLAEHLIGRGHTVRALCRASSDTTFIASTGADIVRGDVRDDPAVLAGHMAGCSHLVHAAALVYSGGSWEGIRAVNVDGTRRVLESASRAGVTHAVHISTVAVYGAAPGPVDESTPIDGPLHPGDLYARSKREAERVAREIERERGLPVTIVRPSAVYGVRDRLMIPAVVGFVRGPVTPLLGSGTNALPVVYAGNVAVALGLILEEGSGGETFDVGMDLPLSQRGLFDGLARGLDRRARFVRVPASAVRGAATILSRLGIDTPGAAHLTLDRVARLALEPNPFPSTRIRERLGWNPPFAHDPALERAARWWRSSQP